MQPEKAMDRIKQMGYDTDKFYSSTLEERPVYVIGASSENDSSNQFWIDQEHLYFVKMIKNYDWGYQEVVFDDYIELNGMGWIEQEVRFYVNNELYLIEKYYNIEVPDVQDNQLFEPKLFSENMKNLRDLRFLNLPEFSITPKTSVFRLILMSLM